MEWLESWVERALDVQEIFGAVYLRLAQGGGISRAGTE
jgi:hypothetical protein